ncbi:protein of unknown function [Taphrina deformans PYCC 5710]|uniref:NADAR domain-containing protein n=1 Tax=Taphrina deformans (strain PYCC 5710 / ATCC 11124 / CBS 356.35 / IMI 108563 / JCM 9778 / NBRC 8474) TaxID=1097556 RepID=R4XFD1_TAPDE|nr:protein of unknown function [Taphrina deformans PYCC 5710]|eukprot:CCG83156.1 protein of unknown function [Taphrina deformans PYCC 5710]
MTAVPTTKQLEGAVYFWNADQPNGEFSQWYPSSFVVAGQSYPTAEHYMMAAKARLFRDHDSERLIIDATEPEQVRDLGRKIKNFDGKLWNEKKFALVLDGNRAKFKDPILRAVMLGTGDRIFVEASPVDRIWGVGFDRDEAPKRVSEWGENLMGKVMMQVLTPCI